MDEKVRKEDVFKSEQPAEDAKKSPEPPKMDDMIMNHFGFVKKMHFKPSMRAPEESNYAFCQTQRFLPQNFSDAHSSTVMVSLGHHIPAHAAFESMKKYQLHQMEIMKGKPNKGLFLPNMALFLPNMALFLPNMALSLPNIVLLLLFSSIEFLVHPSKHMTSKQRH